MSPSSRSYDEIYRDFRWSVPAEFNIGVEVCDRWAALDPNRLALIASTPDGRTQDVSYGWLRETSNRIAHALRANGIARGDRVVVEGFQKISPGTQVRPVEWKLVLPGGTEFVPPESTLSETALQY